MISERLLKSQNLVREQYDPNFSWLELETSVWTEFKKPLAQSNIALITSCGFYRVDMHIPFDAWNNFGDPSFREINIDTPLDRLRLAHSHYPHNFILQDMEVALPIEHFKAFEKDSVIGKFYPWVYSFNGYIPEPQQFIKETCDTISHRLVADQVDGALLTPC
jgi:D-proline reductase (dithiol) PrdB